MTVRYDISCGRLSPESVPTRYSVPAAAAFAALERDSAHEGRPPKWSESPMTFLDQKRPDMQTWTDERVERLKKLWADGLSASQIAGELGGITRNAVIGKVHRLGLSGRAKAPSSSAP